MEINIKATRVFEDNWSAINSDKRFIVNQGGSRSSKTYSIAQCLILHCLQNPKSIISIIRKTSPALMATAARDFFDIMRDFNLYNDNSYNRGDRIYTFDNGSIVEFFSADDPQKLRGRKRDIAWINEANELFYDDFQQINLRTSDKIIIDFNPSEIDSYLYALPQDKTVVIHSTYKDNPFLPQALIDEIENYKNTDEDYYTVFALGQRAYSRENVYKRWDLANTKPEHLTNFIYGIDYGYQHPTAMVKIWYTPTNREVFIEELIYESHLTSNDIIAKMSDLNVDKNVVIVSETARPEIIADIRGAGYKIVEAIKDVRDGINTVKTFSIALSTAAHNIQKENMNYKYKKYNGAITEEVVKNYDDAMDAIRYALMYIKKHLLNSNNTTKIYTFNI